MLTEISIEEAIEMWRNIEDVIAFVPVFESGWLHYRRMNFADLMDNMILMKQDNSEAKKIKKMVDHDEIMRLAAKGRSDREIAKLVQLPVKEVKEIIESYK